jgi:hypothetical protein
MSLQSMLQHAWYTQDNLSEIKAYSCLAIVYFNLADLKNSRYYHEKTMMQALEPAESRTKMLACQEVLWKLKERDKERVIGYLTEQVVD